MKVIIHKIENLTLDLSQIRRGAEEEGDTDSTGNPQTEGVPDFPDFLKVLLDTLGVRYEKVSREDAFNEAARKIATRMDLIHHVIHELGWENPDTVKIITASVCPKSSDIPTLIGNTVKNIDPQFTSQETMDFLCKELQMSMVKVIDFEARKKEKAGKSEDKS